MALILYIASILYANDMITIGQITSFFFYMITMLFQFYILSFVFGNVMTIMGSSHRLVKMMRYQPKINTVGGLKFEGDDI
jgi:ABC-type multidrug transport system fused ATPase/permease subunit